MSSMRTARNTIACSAVREAMSTGGVTAPHAGPDDDMPWGAVGHSSYIGDFPWGDMPWG
ncbi:hypothetical protein [Streptomyces sp. V2I9]|uniref:hypothetical protein n=1 Tax=unclassified Streptomyces TaxID=2593676 RepID=UPI00278A4366|nr:hypothetical protein [Streptomyces sp. V2I9]MDQ0986981.1 hypothetical protein [Streptomyces sp. V2I9]